MTNAAERPMAIIGAGPCGLAACKTLSDYGIDYECLEASEGIGGIWDVERKAGGGYRSLQTNTSKPGMQFTDFPFEHGAPIYPNADQMLDYFKRYADEFDLLHSIKLKSAVANAQVQADGSWRLTLKNGEQKHYRGVIVASGQYVKPRSPHDDIAGHFSGHHLHVYEYLDASTPIDMRNKRVLVVGLGSSAAELAAELCNSEAVAGRAGQVILSARSGRWVIPKITDGVPLDARGVHSSVRPSAWLRALPGDSAQWLARRVMGAGLKKLSQQLGGAAALGLPEPRIQPWEDRPTMSIDFIPALQAGLIDTRPGIQKFEGEQVYFTDDSSTPVDIILYATGYQMDFPYLSEQTLGCSAPDLALYQKVSHPQHDNLFFVGCARAMCSLWPLAEQQSRWIARYLQGQFALPPRSTCEKRAESLAESLPVICNLYVEKLRSEAGGF